MPAVKVAAATPKLVPSAPESNRANPATAGKRVRLAKALAARPAEKSAGKCVPAIQSERDEATPKKVRLRSESYTIPDNEYAQLKALKRRLLTLGVSAKKSQLIRAGLLLLVAINDARLKAAVAKCGARRVSVERENIADE